MFFWRRSLPLLFLPLVLRVCLLLRFRRLLRRFLRLRVLPVRPLDLDGAPLHQLHLCALAHLRVVGRGGGFTSPSRRSMHASKRVLLAEGAATKGAAPRARSPPSSPSPSPAPPPPPCAREENTHVPGQTALSCASPPYISHPAPTHTAGGRAAGQAGGRRALELRRVPLVGVPQPLELLIFRLRVRLVAERPV